MVDLPLTRLETARYAMFISGTSFLNHGLYAKPILKSSWINAYFAGFQCIEYTSGEVDTPISPIPAERASGAMLMNGTAVEITL